VACGQAHSWGGNGGKIAPPIPNVEPNFFRLMKLLMCKPNKYFSAKLLKEPNLLQFLVEPDQSSMVYQLSMIKLRVDISDNEIETCISPLAITNRK